MADSIQWFAGVDWASEIHQVVLVDAHGTVAGAKDDNLDGRVLGDSPRTDRHCFRPLRPADPNAVELREWSRMTEDLQQERNRLSNRVREQLWRYYPQMLALTDDAGADWFLALWALAPTPVRATRIHKATIGRLLKAHRIRRISEDEALRVPRQRPVQVAPGTTEAAAAHIGSIAVRLKVVNRQIKDALRRLDALRARLADPEDPERGQNPEQRDVTILRSLRGVGRIVLATLLAEAWEPLRERDYHALRSLCEARRSQGAAVNAVSWSYARRVTCGCRRRSIIGRGSPFNTMS